jgi:rod shape determining protein RodA
MRKKWDWLLFAQILAIGLISILIILSINKNLAQNQFIFWLVGLAVLYVVSQFNYHSWQTPTRFIYIGSLIALIVLLVIGDPVRGSIRWIDLGFFRIQPSEIAKAASVFLLANFYKDKSARDIKNVFVSFLMILPAILFVFIQPDLGNSLTFLAIWFGINLAAGFQVKHLATFLFASVALLLIFYEMLAPYQKNRLATFVDPGSDPLGTGYNIIQSKIAIGSGKFLGRGFGKGSQSQLNFLPEAESDFIFASIAEQLGFIGAGLLLTLFVWMITRIVAITKDKDRYAQLLLVGIVSFLITQFAVNVGMNLAILPVTGITFPFVSYGGSSLLTCLFLLGIVYAISLA